MGLIQYFNLSGYFQPLINQAPLGEAFANLRQRNQFASLTNIALVALVFMMLTCAEQADNVRPQRLWLAMGAAGFLAVGNAISSSRTGLLQLALICVLLGVWGSWRLPWIRRLLLGTVLAYAVALVCLPYLVGLDVFAFGAISRFGNDDACASRLVLWSNVLHLIAQKPWLGWGWGELDYAHFITLYNGPRFCDILDNAHNLPLHLAVELGVPLALLVCGGFGWWVLRQKPWAERDTTRQMAWAVIAVILLHSMLEYPLWYGPFQMAFGICMALLIANPKPDLEAQDNSKNIPNKPVAKVLYRRIATVVIAIALLVSTAYAAWDYRRISQIYLQPDQRDVQYQSDTLGKIRSSWLYAAQVQFAELMVTPLSAATAAWTFNTATRLLHYSPEPRVVEKLIESAVMLGRDDEALAFIARYRAAFPEEHGQWAKANAKPNLQPDSKPAPKPDSKPI